MKMKEKIKGIVRAIRSVFLFFSLLFIVIWIGCFFYSAGKLVIQSVSYRGHSVGEVVRIERWMGLNSDAEAYNFNIITYRYQTEDGRMMTGEEDTNSRKTTEADEFVKEIAELNPDIRVGARQKLLYNLNDPHKVVSEYYRKNLEMLCLATGVSSAAIVMVIVLARWLIRRRRRQNGK